MDKKIDLIPAVIYARYSSSNQREESIEGQLRECHAYAKRNGMVVVGEYTDHALTGRTDKRPGFQRMIADSEKGQFQVVICWKMDRFARNRYDSATYKYKLKRNGVRLAYAVEAIPEGPEGIILESVMEGYAEYYSENLAQNIRRGMYENALACKMLTSPCFGYCKGADGRYAIHEQEGQMVKKIFRDYLSGIPVKQIVEELNAAGFCTNKGKKFTKSAITYMLKNEKYIGVYQYKDIRVENGIPALISRSDFESAQLLLKKHSEAPAGLQGTYYLSTKLHCGECGANFVGEYATSRNGKRHFYYACMGKRQHECSMPRLHKEDIEEMIINELVKLVFDDDFVDEVAELVVQYQDKLTQNSLIPALEARIKDLERRIGNTMRVIDEGLLTPATAKHLKDLEQELADAKQQMAKELISTPMLDKDHVVYFLETLRKGDAGTRKYHERLIDTFLQGAYIYKDHVVIYLNYTGKKSPITKELADTLKAPNNGASNGVRISSKESRLLCQVRTFPAILTVDTLALMIA